MSLDQFQICSKIEPKLKKVVKAFHVFDDRLGLNVLFITSDDNVYGFGQNAYGCCGLGHDNVVNKPQVIPELCHKNIKQLFIGFNFVLALNSDNKLLGWGNNRHGQLGRGYESSKTDCLKPKINNFFKNMKLSQLRCSNYSLALTAKGHVYGWGDNSCGQIGIGKKRKNKNLPTILKSLTKCFIKSIYCAASKSFALTSDGI